MKHPLFKFLFSIKGVVGLATMLLVYLLVQWMVGSDKADQNISSDLTISVIQPAMKTLKDEIKVTGTTIPKEQIMVVTELSGVRVSEVHADVGDRVEKGQKLATLDSESQMHQLNQIQSDFERANDEYVRAEGMKASGAISKQAVVQKRTAMVSAKARLNEARMNVRRGTVTAPEAGVVFERKATIGSLVNASEPLFLIAQDAVIEVEAKVPESSLAKLQIGQKARVKFTGNLKNIHGSIRLIAPRVDDASRTATIRIALDEAGELPVGLFANVAIDAGQAQGLALPATALQLDSEGEFVWQLDGQNKVSRLPVSVIFRGGNHILVEAIAPDARIVAKAGAFVKEGDTVNVKDAPQ